MILYTLAKVYFVFFLLSSIFSKKIKLTKMQFILFWSLFVLSLSLLAYNMKPGIGWDITRHFEYLNQIRSSGMSIQKFLFQNDNLVGGSNYIYLLTFNILRYCVSNISENNYLLPAVCAFIDYGILGYIIFDWSSNNYGNYKTDIYTLLLSFTFLSFESVTSGIRNALSASIMGLAVYLYLYKNKNIAVLIILSFIAVTVHPAVLITIPFIFIAKLNVGILGYIAVFTVSALMMPTAKFFMNSNISFLASIGIKFYHYTVEANIYSYQGSRYAKYTAMIIIIIYLIVYFVLYKKSNAPEKQFSTKKIYNFFAIYIFFILCNVGSNEMFSRPLFVLGSLAPILSSFFTDTKMWLNKEEITGIYSFADLGVKIIILALCFYFQYKFFMQYGNNFFI